MHAYSNLTRVKQQREQQKSQLVNLAAFLYVISYIEWLACPQF